MAPHRDPSERAAAIDVSDEPLLSSTDEAAVVAALDSIRRESFEGMAPSQPAREDSERIVGLVRQLSQQATSAAAVETQSPPPTLEPAMSVKSLAVQQAQGLLEAFDWASVRTLLLPYADAGDARARTALAESCLHLCEDALAAKETATAKEHALESLAHASAAVELDETSAAARVWYGQAVGTKAKVLDGGMGQARVCGTMVQSWDKAVELAPHEPLAYHLLGSFAFHVSALPWAASAAMRSLAPGLRKFSADDSLRYLEQSEERMAGAGRGAGSPRPFSLTNKSMIGRLLVAKGKKGEGKMWLQKAVAMEDAGGRLDDAAKEAAADARKALKKM